MKNIILALTLGLTLSVVGQNKPSGDVRAKKIETTGNQLNHSNTQSNTVVSPSTPVRNNNSVQTIDVRAEDRRNDDNRDYYRYDRGNNVDNVYEGRYYTPPTRNEMRYNQGHQCFTAFELNLRPFTIPIW